MTVIFYKDKWNEDNLKKIGLNERQIKAVDYIKTNKAITLSSFKDLVTGVSEKTLYRDFQDLVNRNIFKEIGDKKGRKYELL
jgi:ATP-dependent DNA helicase RecG